MGGQPLNIPVNVMPGQAVDLSVTLVAPQEPSIYQGFRQIETDHGSRFGQTVWVAITTQTGENTPVATATTTATATAQTSGNSCTVTGTLPTDAIKVGGNFDAVWTVQNTSGKDWSTDSVDYKYVSGTKMHEIDLYDLKETIKNGESGKIIVDMIAPSKPGLYSTNWALTLGNTTLCTLSVTVNVVAK